MTSGAATTDMTEARLTIAPRVVPRLGDSDETGLGSWERIALDASRVTKNMPVVLTSRKRLKSANGNVAMSAPC